MTDILPLRAGVTRQVITPPRGIYLIGYGDRSKGNTGVHDDLTATALALDDGRKCLALVACDLLCLNEFIVDRARARVGSDTEVLMICSHTHSGPIGYAGDRSGTAERAYIDRLVECISQAVGEAKASAVPARLTWGRGEANIAVNRRERKPDGRIEIGINPDGTVDRSLNVVSVTAESGDVLATLVNFACHGTVMGPKSLLVSADWIGAMRARVESAGKGKVLFLQGATGNMNPAMGWEEGKDFSTGWDLIQSEGSTVGDAVLEVYKKEMQPLNPAPLGVIRQEVWLPLEAPATTPTPPPNYRKRMLEMAKLPGILYPLTDYLLNQRYPWRSRIEARDGAWCVPLRVNTARIGDLALASFGAEVFTEIGMAIKSTSPAPLTLFTSLTDGCIGYLFTAEAHGEGGYEVDVAPYAYRYPSRLSRQCAALATSAALESLRELYKA